jgi:hypothetical protein
MKRAIPILAVVAAAATPSAATAADNAVPGSAFTVYGGYRGGGGFTDAGTEQAMDLEGSGAFGLALDLPLDGARQYQIFLSRQGTRLNAGAASPGETLSMSVTYLHIGGTSFIEGTAGRGPYVVGGLGATVFSPGASGYSNEVRASANVGVGYQWPLGERMAIRVEARGYLTLVNSSGGLFCSGGCVVSVKGDIFTQGEALIGLTARF